MNCKSGDDWVSACRNVEVVGGRVRAGAGRLGENVYRMTWMSLVCTLNGQCLGICGEASYRGKRLTVAEHGRNRRFKSK